MKSARKIEICVLIPDSNPEDDAVKTVRSVMRQTIKPDEIEIICNGAADVSHEIAVSLKCICTFHAIPVPSPDKDFKIRCEKPYAAFEGFCEDIRIRILCKRMSNKADALNAGALLTGCDYILTVDADSVLKRDCIEQLITVAENNRDISAVGGSVWTISDNWNFLSAVQWVEYARSFKLARNVFSSINGVLLLSGTLSLFRRSVLLLAGGFNIRVLGEDMEAVVKIQYLSHINGSRDKICYCEKAVCYTSVPCSFGKLLRQRIRWHIGLIQTLLIHRNMFFNLRCGTCGIISYPYILIFELLKCYLDLVIFVILTVSVMTGTLSFKGMILTGMFFFWFYELPSLFALVLFSLEKKRRVSLKAAVQFLTVGVFEYCILRPALNLVKVYATIRYDYYKDKWRKKR